MEKNDSIMKWNFFLNGGEKKMEIKQIKNGRKKQLRKIKNNKNC